MKLMKFIDVIHFTINGLARYVLPDSGIVMLNDMCQNEVTVMSYIVSAGSVNENVKLQVVFLT